MTSHDVVARIRRLAHTRRVGHAGTLDPMATGVLVIGIEKATRLLGHLMLTEKTYEATIRLGQSTSTDDAEGEPTGGSPASGVTREALDAEIAKLTGEILQVPLERQRDQGERPARLQADPGRRRRRSWPPARSPSTSSRSPPSARTATSSTSTRRSAAQAAPTSAPSPATSAPPWAPAAT